MTHKLLAVLSTAALALSVVSACAQVDAAATTTGTGSTVVENLLNLPPQFVPSTTDEHQPIHL